MSENTGRETRSRTILILGLALAVAASMASTPAPAQSKDAKYIEWFAAKAYTVTESVAQTSSVEIGLTGWTTEQDEQALVAILIEKGREEFVKALADQPDLGFMRHETQRATIRYAEQWEEDGKRHIVLATDRPLGQMEALGRDRTTRFNVTMVALELNDKNKGTGHFAPGVEMGYDQDANHITMNIYDVQPVRLTNVRPRPKKVYKPE